MNNENLVTSIRNGEQKGFNQLYRYFKVVRKWLLAHGCPKDQVEDVYQQALLVFCEKCQNDDFELTSSVDTYLFSISKYIHFKSVRDKKDVQFTDDFDKVQTVVDQVDDEHEKLSLALRALEAVSDRCKKIFRLFYFERKSMTEIAKLLQFKSAKVTRNQKYKCLQYAKQSLAKLQTRT